MTAPHLDLLFANQDALAPMLGLTGPDLSRALPSGTATQRDLARQQQLLTERLEAFMDQLAPVELQRAWATGTASVGQVVALEQRFYFKKQARSGLVRCHAPLNTDNTVKVEGVLDSSRYPFASTHEHLSGSTNVFMIASISRIEARTITLRPAFIGWRRWSGAKGPVGGHDSAARRIYPQQVDQFRRVEWSRAPTAADMKAMATMPEARVKDSLATILGFPFKVADWGGERSDLLTNNLLVDGMQTSSSWLLKGSSVQESMKIKHLGKNGDQIERLTTDSSDVMVIQHNQAITAAVVNLAAAFAHDMRRPRRYMILDGQATAMVLRDHALLHL